jgi:hypothetical protein
MTQKTLRLLFAEFSIILIMTLSSCRTFVPGPGNPMPNIQGGISVQISPNYPIREDLPASARTVPNTHFYVSSTVEETKIGDFSRDVEKTKIKDFNDRFRHSREYDNIISIPEIQKMFDLDLIAETSLAFEHTLHNKNIQTPWNQIDEPENASYILEVMPYGIFAARTNSRARLYVFLSAQLKSKADETMWWSRYIYYAPETRLIEGKESWSENDGELFKKAVRTGLKDIINVMVEDSKQPESDLKKREVLLATRLAYYFHVTEFQGILFSENSEQVVFLPTKSGMRGIAGIHIIPRDEVEIRDIPTE